MAAPTDGTFFSTLQAVLASDLPDTALCYVQDSSNSDDDPAGTDPKDRKITVGELKKLFKESDADFNVRVDARFASQLEGFARRSSSNVVPINKIPEIPEEKLSTSVQQKLNNEVDFDFPGTAANLTKDQRLLSQQIDSPLSAQKLGEITFGAANNDLIYYRKQGSGGDDVLVDEINFKFDLVGSNTYQWGSKHNLPAQIEYGSVDGEIGDDFGSLISIISSGSPQIRWKPSGQDIIAVYDATNDVYYHLPSAQNTTSASWHFRVLPAGLSSAISAAGQAGTALKLKIIYHYGSTAKVTKKGTSGEETEIDFFTDNGLPSGGWGNWGWFKGTENSTSSTGAIVNGLAGDDFGSLLLLSNSYIAVKGDTLVKSIKNLDTEAVTAVPQTGWTSANSFGVAGHWIAIPSAVGALFDSGKKLSLEITYSDDTKAKISTFTSIPSVGSVSDEIKSSPLEQINKNSNGDIFLWLSGEELINEFVIDRHKIDFRSHIWIEGPNDRFYIRLNAQNREFQLLNPYLEYGSEHSFGVITDRANYGFEDEIPEVASVKEFPAGGLAVIGKNSEIVQAQGKQTIKITLSDQASGDEGEYRTAGVYTGIGAIGNSDSPMYLQALNENSMVISKSLYDREFSFADNPVVKLHIGSRSYTLHNLNIAEGSFLGFNGHGEKTIAPFGTFLRLKFSALTLHDFGEEKDLKFEKRNGNYVNFRVITPESTNVFGNVEVFGSVNGRPPEDFNDIIRPGIFHFGQGTTHLNGPDGADEKIYQGILQSVYLESGGFRPGKVTGASGYVVPTDGSAEVRFFGPTVHTEQGLRGSLTDEIEFKFEASGNGYAWTDYSLTEIQGQDDVGSIENGVAGDSFGPLFSITVANSGGLGYLFTSVVEGFSYVISKIKLGSSAEVNVASSQTNQTIGGQAVKRQSIPSSVRVALWNLVRAGNNATIEITYTKTPVTQGGNASGTQSTQKARILQTGDFHHGSVRIEYDGHDIPYFLDFETGTNKQARLFIPDIWANLIQGSGETVKVSVKIGSKTVSRTISLDNSASTTENVTGYKLNGLTVSRIYRSPIEVSSGAWPSPSTEGAYNEIEVDMEWTHNNIVSGGIVHETGLLHYWVSEKQKISKRFQVGKEGTFEKITADWQQIKPADKNKIVAEIVSEIPTSAEGKAKHPKLSALVAPDENDNEEALYLKFTSGTDGADFTIKSIDSLFTDYVAPTTHKVRYEVPDNPSTGDTFRAGQDIYPNQNEPLKVTITPAGFSSETVQRFGYRSNQFGDAEGSITLDPTKKLGLAYSYNYNDEGWNSVIVLKKSDHPRNISGGLDVGARKLSSVKLKVPVDTAYQLSFLNEQDKSGTLFWTYSVDNASVNLFPIGTACPIDLRAHGNLIWPNLHFEAGKYYRFLATGVWEEFSP